jgi:glycosyltransferase involved in cell wall biosynthesis
VRIGIILRVLWPAASPRFAIEEARHLKMLGHRVRLLVCRESEYQFRYDKILQDLGDVKFITKGTTSRLSELINFPTLLSFPKGLRGRESTIDISTLLTLPFFLPRSSYDTILCHDQFAGLSGYVTFKVRGIPYSLYLYETVVFGGVLGVDPRELPLRSRLIYKLTSSIEAEILKEALSVITISQKTAKYVKELLPDQNKVRVVYPGCNPVENPNLERGRYVLVLSRWDKGRKPSFILDIAERVKDAKIIMAGAFTPSHLELEFRREVKARKLLDRVKIISSLSEEIISELYQNALVNLRWGNEGFGMSVLECMANACPVILQKELGASEIVEHSVQGFIVDGLDAEKFASYVSSLLSNPDLARKMGLEAWKLSKKYTWEAHTRKLVEAFEGSLEK